MIIWNHDINMAAMTGDANSYIRLRQPNNAEWKVVFRINKALPNLATDSDAACDALTDFCDLLKTLIIDHNIYDGDKKLANKEIADYINGDIMLTSSVLREYSSALPLLKANSKK